MRIMQVPKIKKKIKYWCWKLNIVLFAIKYLCFLKTRKKSIIIHWRLTKADKLMTKHKKQFLQETFYYWQYLLLQRNTLDFWIYQFINISQILEKLFVLMKIFWKYNDNFQRKMQMKTKDLKPDTYILICFWTPKLFFLSNDLRNLQATQKTNKIIT